jgi:hypothetical protein
VCAAIEVAGRTTSEIRRLRERKSTERRKLKRQREKKAGFQVGQRVMVTRSNGEKKPAVVEEVYGNGRYGVAGYETRYKDHAVKRRKWRKNVHANAITLG